MEMQAPEIGLSIQDLAPLALERFDAYWIGAMAEQLPSSHG